MTNSKILILIFVVGCHFITGLHASDLAKEQRWREQIIDVLFEGEPIDLNDGQNDFLAIYTEAESSQPAGLVILHGTGIHPDYPTVINPLRIGLAEKGWNTLSLQLPILSNEASAQDYEPLIADATPRIKAGIDFLKQAGHSLVIIIAHSLGASMAGHALANHAMESSGFIAIGMGSDGPQYLKKINLPVLDLYGADDLAGVTAAATDKKAASAHNKDYSQLTVNNADHFFSEQEDRLILVVANWLKKQSWK